MLPPPKKRYEHIHVRLAVAIPGHRHFWEGVTPLFFETFSNARQSEGILRLEPRLASYNSDC
ncbi:hypothetical protein SAMN04488073_2874 [Marinobacter gudaonensis]|uniref:Uncharacterized protein n=1 Tax=Marinobacter gudaonensis TaxID=375760 RepID=A0A1I6HPJ3_9GAMM|nr:hypothetical protein SAMN04488073_2874 [Marinobacter gudaonensis]